MATTWKRTLHQQQDRDVGFQLLAQIPSGSTLIRTHFTWGYSGFTPTTDDVLVVSQSTTVFGICTVIGNGSESPPTPITTPNNASPPTQRWVWWEARAPIVAAVDYTSGTVWWRDHPRGESGTSEAQVKATGLPGGDTLDVWASWESHSTWPTDGNVQLWFGASVLYETSP